MEYKEYNALLWDNGSLEDININLVTESRFEIFINNEVYKTVSHTPGMEKEHAAGFCVSEGLIYNRKDISSIELEEEKGITKAMVQGNVIEKPSELPKKFLNMDSLFAALDIFKVRKRIDGLTAIQKLRMVTFSTHAAAIYDKNYNFIAVAEDVGRQNAVDKAIGKAFLDRIIERSAFMVLSSRINSEITMKSARAGIRFVFSISRPTSGAVDLAIKNNMVIGCLAPRAKMFIYK